MNMPNPPRPGLAAVGALVLLVSGTLPAEGTPRLEGLIPDDVIAYARFVGVTKKVEAFVESDLGRKIASSPLFEELLADPGVRGGLERIREVENRAGRSLTNLLGELFRREVAIGFFLDFSGPQGVLLARFAGGEEAWKMVARIREAAVAATGKPLEAARSEYEGESIETFDRVAFLVIDDVLAVSNQAGILETVVDLAAGRSERSVLRSKTYGPAVDGAGPLVRLAVRPNFLPAVRLPEKLGALPSLFFGGWLGAIHASELLTVDLDLERSRLGLRVASLVGPRISGRLPAVWFPATGSGSVAGRLMGMRGLAVAEIRRDLSAWWANRAELVDERAAGGLDVFAQYISVIFGGSQFERDVLSRVGSPITIVARRQRYPGATPEPAVPEFAAIVPFRGGAGFGESLLAALQRLVGIARVDQLRRGGGRSAPALRTKSVGDRVLHYVELTKPDSASGFADNFSPTLALLDSHAVLSSTTSLAASLVGELEALPPAESVGPGPAAPGSPDLLIVDCGELRKALEDHHGLLGNEAGLGDVLRFLEPFDDLRLSSARKGDLVCLSLELAARAR